MIDIEDKTYKPDIDEIKDYIGNSLFSELYECMDTRYSALYDIAYSGDKVLLGWNVRFYKSGKTLCRVYPRKGCFIVLIVIGSKEKEQTETILPKLSKEVQRIYTETREGMGQRWLIIDLVSKDEIYEDLLTLIEIRRQSKK